LGGDPLTEAEDAEEAQARARALAFEESPEGRDRTRIRELELKDMCKGRSTAEQQELNDLRRRYSIRKVDITKDPLMQAIERFLKKHRSEEAEDDEKRKLRRLEQQRETAAAAHKDE
jgi:hypothetical protein